MSNKKKYRDLASAVTHLGIAVHDFDYYGYCMFMIEAVKAVVNIHPRLPWNQKLMTLAHEAGHLTKMDKNGKLTLRKRAATEDRANKEAIKILDYLDFDGDYWKFYRFAVKRNKRRKKSWHEIK